MSDFSSKNDFIFQFIFEDSKTKQLPPKNERNEYKIKLETNLFDPSERKRLKHRHKNNILKKKKQGFNFKKTAYTGIKGRPPKHIVL